MSVDLSDYTTVLKRAINPPGTDLFSSMTDDELAGYLADAFWEASLDGFLHAWACDEDGVVTPVDSSGADLPRADVSLIVLYASIKMLRNKILNTPTVFQAGAGGATFERQYSANMLTEVLQQLKDAKEKIIERSNVWGSLDLAIDGFSTRLFSGMSYYGNPAIAGQLW